MLSLFLDTAWKVLLAGLVLGAGLPALFALGTRLTAVGTGHTVEGAPRGAGATAAGVLCYALVAVAVLLGISIIVAAGLGKVVDFSHVYPTFVPKS